MRGARCLLAQIMAFAVLAAGCAPASVSVGPAAPTPAAHVLPVAAAQPADQGLARSLSALILAERQAAIEGDLDLLRQLWAPDARIVDGRGTAETADDYVWPGREAILDRYGLAVFPSPPPPLDESQMAGLVVSAGDDGTAEAALGVDRWRFVYGDGGWLLAELRYN